VLTTIAGSGSVTAADLGMTAVRLVMFLAPLIGFGILTVPRAIRAVQRLGRPETTLVASIGICFAAALLALSFGYSVALGAFIAGSRRNNRSEEHTSELQSRGHLVCRLLLEKKNNAVDQIQPRDRDLLRYLSQDVDG